MTERVFVTGSSGFVGQHLARRLRADGCDVTTYDRKDGQDVLDTTLLTHAMNRAQPAVVYHLAALADVRHALVQHAEQIQQNFLATAHVLEAMLDIMLRVRPLPRLVFTSSAVVYGRGSDGQQTSIYGAMKLASEALIEAYSEGYGLRADIFRFVSLVGEGYRHGNVWDFYQRLKADPTRITIVGPRTQPKYYCYVGDAVEAIRCVDAIQHPGVSRWDVSHAHPNTIQDSLEAVCGALQIKPVIEDGPPTWTGDLPALCLDTSALRQIGWSTKVSILEGLRRTVEDFIARGL